MYDNFKKIFIKIINGLYLFHNDSGKKSNKRLLYFQRAHTREEGWTSQVKTDDCWPSNSPEYGPVYFYCFIIEFTLMQHEIPILPKIIRKIIPHTRKLNGSEIAHQYETKSIQEDGMQPFTANCLEAALPGWGAHGMGPSEKSRRQGLCNLGASPASTIARSVPQFLHLWFY